MSAVGEVFGPWRDASCLWGDVHWLSGRLWAVGDVHWLWGSVRMLGSRDPAEHDFNIRGTIST